MAFIGFFTFTASLMLLSLLHVPYWQGTLVSLLEYHKSEQHLPPTRDRKLAARFSCHVFISDFQKSSEMAADLVVTLTITTFFMRSKTGWKATDKVISRLLR